MVGLHTKHFQIQPPVGKAGGDQSADAADEDTEHGEVRGLLEVPQLLARREAGLTLHLVLFCV